MSQLPKSPSEPMLEQYLESSQYIDWQSPAIIELATDLAAGKDDPTSIAQACFEWVRDNIQHSSDYQLNPVTCVASDVLQHQTGYCYAKSHLLAALLRANKIPAGLCYQRLSVFEDGAPYSLHGLNAVYLPETGWYRIDARGNKPGINAQFTPPHEQLAFAIVDPNECNIDGIWHVPLQIVVNTLEKYTTYQEVLDNLPDIDNNHA